MAASPPTCDFGAPAPDFRLTDTDGHAHSRDSLRGPGGLLVMFICNHCPYVVAIAPKLARDGAALQALGIGVAAICSNDAAAYPQDSFQNMGPFARRYGFRFPYLHDPDQSVARAFGAVCTPDFFGYGADTGLQYRGRFDDSGRQASDTARRDLFDAMSAVARTGSGPRDQVPSIGCSIKWVA